MARHLLTQLRVDPEQDYHMRSLLHGCRRLWSVGLVSLALAPAASLAAPLCVRTQSVPPQCLYTDPSTCQRDALQQGGVCEANPAEYKPNPGLGQYCVVTASMVSLCIYPDRGSCMTDAARRGGTCVTAPSRAPYKAPDPYRALGGD